MICEGFFKHDGASDFSVLCRSEGWGNLKVFGERNIAKYKQRHLRLVDEKS